MLDSVVTFLVDLIGSLGYLGIIALMALESSFFPFPSEVVLPPAGYLASQGRMNIYVAIGCGVLGSVIGALFNYWVAVKLGRPLLHKYSRRLLIKEGALDKAEDFFRRHGEISTFVGRLLPVIRQYVSLPAGLARMNLARFSVYTALGAGIWCAILAAIGWVVGRQLGGLNEEQVHRYTVTAFLALLPLLTVGVGIYIWRHRRQRSGS